MKTTRRSMALTRLAMVMLPAAALSGCASQESEEGVAKAQEAVTVAAPVVPPAVANDTVELAAERALPALLRTIPENRETEFGFSARSEFDSAKVGQPYEMFELADDGAVKELAYWRVPVLVEGKARAFVDVRQLDGKYKARAIGGSGLATELAGVESARSLAGGSLRNKAILRSYSRKADFAAFGGDVRRADGRAQLGIVPLKSAQQAFSGKMGARNQRSTGSLAARGGHAEALTMDQLQSLLAK